MHTQARVLLKKPSTGTLPSLWCCDPRLRNCGGEAELPICFPQSPFVPHPVTAILSLEMSKDFKWKRK